MIIGKATARKNDEVAYFHLETIGFNWTIKSMANDKQEMKKNHTTNNSIEWLRLLELSTDNNIDDIINNNDN